MTSVAPFIDKVLSLHQTKLVDLHQRLIRALQQLNDDDVNWRPNDESNSIANLVVHMVGNLRQRYVAGLKGAMDERDRDEEFNSREVFSREKLVDMTNQIFAESLRVMKSITREMLGQEYVIQDESVTALETIFGTVTHMSEHVGQILYIAKLRLGSDYQVLWMPHNKK